MWIACGQESQTKESTRDHKDRGNDLDCLNEQTRERPSQRLKAKRDEAEDAIHPSLQLFWDQRQPITHNIEAPLSPIT
jgi:hypothetical protein